MKHEIGDLLESDWDCAIHCANSYCVMGSGIAYFLKKKWPSVYQVDMETIHITEDNKLGGFTFSQVEKEKYVFNLYAQKGVGNDGHPLNRNCSYDAMFNSLYRSCEQMKTLFPLTENITVGVPKYMGCCRAGGEWIIVESILKSIEDLFPEISFTIYELENGEMKAQSSVKI